MGKQNAGVWAGVVLLIFASVFFWQSLSLKYQTKFGPGPGMFPRWLSGILIVLTLIYIWQSVNKEVIRFSDILPKGKDLGNLIAVLGSVVLFILVVNYTGFTIAGTALLFILFVRQFKWYTALGMSLLVTLILFYIFKSLLSIPLPVNAFGW
jgi:putative tricarboxylic transport membrane protein